MQNEYAIFNRNWPVYRKLVINNYMRHREFGAITSDWLKKTNGPGEHRLLDLGCGDAEEIAKGLNGISIGSYTGIDLSNMALELAQQHLKGVASVTLHAGAMEQLIDQTEGSFSIIHSSYAIHHLQDDEKQRLLRSINQRLADGGLFLWTDIFRMPGQERSDYLDRYRKMVSTSWTNMDGAEQEAIFEHIMSSDFPARIDEAKLWLDLSGFTLLESHESDEQHKMLVLTKSA